MLNRQIPLLRVRKTIRVLGSVRGCAQAIGERRIDERRLLDTVDRETVVDVESRVETAQSLGAKRATAVEARLVDTASPARIEGLGVEDAVSASHNGFIVYCIGKAQARSETAVPVALG